MNEACPKNLSVVVFKESELWVAQCLQYDIAAQADSWGDALRNLEMTINGRIAVCRKESVNPFDIPQAPKEYWELFQPHHPTQFVIKII